MRHLPSLSRIGSAPQGARLRPQRRAAVVWALLVGWGGGLMAGPAGSVVAPKTDLPVLYGASWCGTCRLARAYLQRTGVEYRYIDIDSAEGKPAFAAAGGGSVPLLVWRGKPLRGYSELAYDFFFAP